MKYLELLPDKTTFDAVIVTFGEPVNTLDAIFEDVKTWGVCSLKGRIDSYESTRFMPIGIDKAVITSEYTIECEKSAWNITCPSRTL